MTKNVYWIFEATIKTGEYAAFEALMTEMVDFVQENEAGTLAYEWYVTEDKTACHIFESYADSSAVFAHLGNFSKKFGKQFNSLLKMTRWAVYGNANESLKKALGGMGVAFMDPVGGYAR